MKNLRVKVKVKIKIKGPTMCTHDKTGVIASMVACAFAGVHTHKVLRLDLHGSSPLQQQQQLSKHAHAGFFLWPAHIKPKQAHGPDLL